MIHTMRTAIMLAVLTAISAVAMQPAQAQIEVTKSNNMVTIDGTRLDDEVTVSIPGAGLLRVRANGQITDFPCQTNGTAAPMIMFFGFGGADDFVNRTRLTAVAFGGSGPDRLVATTGSAFFFGEGGADFIVGSSVADTLEGGLGADEIYGLEGSDDIVAGGGADCVVGGLGNDTISGGLGADFLYGQEGADVIRGGNGEDFISGGLGTDFIEGGSNDDELLGGNSNDTLIGGLGDDLMLGGLGSDFLCGGRGADELRGGDGNDSLFGEEGVDVVLGGTGVDVLDQDAPGPCSFAGLAVVSSEVVFPGSNGRDNNSNGIADVGDTFELDVIVTAGGDGATGVAFGQNFVTIGPARRIGFVGAVFATVAPGQTVRMDRGTDACVVIESTANVGDQIFVVYDVTSDGVTARFRSGPFIVGQISDGQTAAATFLGIQ